MLDMQPTELDDVVLLASGFGSSFVHNANSACVRRISDECSRTLHDVELAYVFFYDSANSNSSRHASDIIRPFKCLDNAECFGSINNGEFPYKASCLVRLATRNSEFNFLHKNCISEKIGV